MHLSCGQKTADGMGVVVHWTAAAVDPCCGPMDGNPNDLQSSDEAKTLRTRSDHKVLVFVVTNNKILRNLTLFYYLRIISLNF